MIKCERDKKNRMMPISRNKRAVFYDGNVLNTKSKVRLFIFCILLHDDTLYSDMKLYILLHLVVEDKDQSQNELLGEY